MALLKVPEAEHIPPGTGKAMHVGDKVLTLFNLKGRFFALDNRCTHVGGPLGEGEVEGTTVTCPWHGKPLRYHDGAGDRTARTQARGHLSGAGGGQ